MTEYEVSEDDRDICFVTESTEFWTYKSTLLQKSEYFRDIIGNLNTDKRHFRILLPKWIQKIPFLVFLEYLEEGIMPKPDLDQLQQLIWIADFLKAQQFIQKCIDELIKPNMTITKVLDYFND